MGINTLYWEITKECNHHCKHCYQGTPKDSLQALNSLGDFIAFADHFAEAGIERVLLTGGEPLKSPYVFQIIKRLKRYGIDVAVLTNGTLINEEIASRIADANPNNVQISIDGLEHTHDLMRGKGAFKKIVKAIGLLNHYGVPLFFKTTINKLNYTEALAIAEYVTGMEARLNFSLVQDIGYAKKGNISLSPEEYFEAFIELFNLKERGDFQIGLPDFAIEEYLKGDKPHSGCGAGRTIAVVTSNNQLLPCPFMAGLDLTPRQGAVRFSFGAFDKIGEYPLFRIMREENASSLDCPIRKFNNGRRDMYSVYAFQEYYKNAHLQRQSRNL